MNLSNHTHIYRLLLPLVAIIASAQCQAFAQSAPPRPKLVVGIVVKGLDSYYLDLLDNYFTPDGFKRLKANGIEVRNLDYGTKLDAAAATAMVFTGTTPAENGVSGDQRYDPDMRRAVPTLLDPSKIGNFTDATLSPAAIAVSTLGDEVRLDAGGTGWVHSIAPDPATAIIMSGHAGNSAFWIDDKTERWATTTYYKDLPQSVNARNYRRPLSTEIDTMAWIPLIAPGKYPDVPEYKTKYPFKHTFSRKDSERIKRFKASPKVNQQVTALALDYLTQMQYGGRGPVDMLNVAYNADPYSYTHDSDNRMETLDAYLRLDKEIATLLKAVDSKVGENNALVFVVGIPGSVSSRRDDEKWGVPSGVFSPRKAMSLLNAYLMALHGNGEWINGYHAGEFYINRKAAKSTGIEMGALRAEAAEFLTRMSGVSEAFTIDDIIAGRAGDNAAALKRNINAAHCGDIFVDITPGWEIVDDFNLPGAGSDSRVVRDNFVSTPLFIIGTGVTPAKITQPTDARSIAPTISKLIRVRTPAAAKTAPIQP